MISHRRDLCVHCGWRGRLEHFQKNCSHAVGKGNEAVFLGFDFVSAQLQGFSNLRQSLAKTQKSSLRMATVFLQTL
jgi:hypothetical protein